MDRTLPPSVAELLARLQHHVPTSAVEQDYVVDAWLAGQEAHLEELPEWDLDPAGPAVSGPAMDGPAVSGPAEPYVDPEGPAVSGPADEGYDPRVTTPQWVLGGEGPAVSGPAEPALDPRVTTTVEDLGVHVPADDGGEVIDPRVTTPIFDVAPRE